MSKAFTAVFRDVTTDEAEALVNHPKWTAGAWSHALDDRDAARAELERLREENKQLAAFVVAVGGVWEPNGPRSVLTGELSLAETINRDAAIAEKAAEAQPVARVTITKPGDSLTGIAFMALNEHGRATLGKGRHELYAHPPADALYTMDQMRDYADSFHRSRVEAMKATPVTAPCEPTKPCECRACLTGKTVELTTGHRVPIAMTRMIVCAKCGNKRCPHANDHRNECTNSNEAGQPGSAY
jgi:hypothetical protein